MKSRFVFLLAAFFLIGCATLPEVPSPETLLANLKSPSVPSAVKGTGEFRLRGPDGFGALRFAFLIAAPDRLRIQALSPLGNLAFLLAQNPGKLQIYLPLEHTLLEDEEARLLLSRYLPPEITTANLVYFLCGRLPASIQGWDLVNVNPAGSALKLKLRGREGGAEAEYSRHNLKLKTLKFFDREEKLSYQVRFKNYQTAAGFFLPTRIEFTIPGPEGATSFRIDLRELEINPELTEDSFRIPALEPLNGF